MGHFIVPPLRVRVVLGVMAMKVYSTLLRFLELEPHLQMNSSYPTKQSTVSQFVMLKRAT